MVVICFKLERKLFTSLKYFLTYFMVHKYSMKRNYSITYMNLLRDSIKLNKISKGCNQFLNVSTSTPLIFFVSINISRYAQGLAPYSSSP